MSKKKAKFILASKTVQLAIIQAVGAVTIAILTELDMVAYVGVTKSVIDVLLRFVTKDPVSVK